MGLHCAVHDSYNISKLDQIHHVHLLSQQLGHQHWSQNYWELKPCVAGSVSPDWCTKHCLPLFRHARPHASTWNWNDWGDASLHHMQLSEAADKHKRLADLQVVTSIFMRWHICSIGVSQSFWWACSTPTNRITWSLLTQMWPSQIFWQITRRVSPPAEPQHIRGPALASYPMWGLPRPGTCHWRQCFWLKMSWYLNHVRTHSWTSPAPVLQSECQSELSHCVQPHV